MQLTALRTAPEAQGVPRCAIAALGSAAAAHQRAAVVLDEHAHLIE
ncbi:MAG: hypothetical protein ABJE95_14690 [Byssovorax sp.]